MNTRKKAPDIRHKHFELDQNKLDLARKLLGATTERETIETLIDRAIAEEAIVEIHREIAGVGGVEDFFGINSMGLDLPETKAAARKARRKK